MTVQESAHVRELLGFVNEYVSRLSRYRGFAVDACREVLSLREGALVRLKSLARSLGILHVTCSASERGGWSSLPTIVYINGADQ